MPEAPSAMPPGRAEEEEIPSARCGGKGDVKTGGAWDYFWEDDFCSSIPSAPESRRYLVKLRSPSFLLKKKSKL